MPKRARPIADRALGTVYRPTARWGFFIRRFASLGGLIRLGRVLHASNVMSDGTLFKSAPGASRPLRMQANRSESLGATLRIALHAISRLSLWIRRGHRNEGNRAWVLAPRKSPVGAPMDKHRVRAIFAAAELAAEATVTTQFGHYDEFDPQHGAAYDRIFYSLLAKRCPNANLEDLLKILNS